MSENTTDTAVANAESQAPSDIDAQLGQMQAAEGEASGEQQQPEQKAEQDAGQKESKVVPLAALHEERRMRQQLQRQIEESNRRQAERDAVIERRLAALMPQQQAPDRNADPVAYLDHRLDQVVQTVQPVMQAQQARMEQEQRAQYEEHLKHVVLQSAAELSRSAPDVSEAAKYLNEMRARELMVFGKTEAEARAIAVQEQDQALMQWAHQGLNAAQMAYEFAKARGYTPKSPASAEEKLSAQQRGAQGSRSLGGGGAVNAGKLTAEALANMSDADFARLTEAQFRQAMGG